MSEDNFKTLAASFKPPTDSLRKPSKADSSSDLDPAYLLKRARMLFACYRKDEAADPEIYCAAVAAVLGEYPREVIEYVTDPRTGIARTITYGLPNIAQIGIALDGRLQYLDRIQNYDERVYEQTRLTEEWLRQTVADGLQDRGRAWLDRTDPAAKQLSGETPKRELSDGEKEKLLESAKEAGKRISTFKLSDEAIALLAQQEKRYVDENSNP